MTRIALLATATACLFAGPLAAQGIQVPAYPETARGEVVDTQFGERIADPYRWLEDDVRTNPQVATWVEAQNRVTQQYLAQLPGREWYEQRLAGLLDYERFGLPVKKGNRYFYSYNPGLLNQAQLYVRDGLDGEARLLIDPNTWASDGATALADWAPSESGRYVAYAVQDGGSDWRTIRVLDTQTGDHVGDEIRWAKFTGIQWDGEDGFFYSRFPEPEAGQDFQARNYNQTVYYHRLGTPQSADEVVFATPDHPERGHGISVSDDGRWGFIISSLGTDSKYEVHVIDLAARGSQGWRARPLVTGFENAWTPNGTVGSTAYFVTDKDAPKSRIVATDLAAATPVWREVVAQTDQPIAGASHIGDKLIVQYLRDAASRAIITDLDGRLLREIEMAGLGSAGGFIGKAGDPETFYAFSSFNRPATIYRLNVDTGETQTFAAPKLTFDPDRYIVEQVFYTSKDGTRVPMFIVRQKDAAQRNQAAPTLLYGYGGFDISLTPSFSATRMAWLEAGGTYALANIRGGGEYGKAWHDGGRLANKQNVFDDFIAAGEFLKANGYTTPNGLAIQGGSNGGLLVGAVVNQRPDLIDAANAAVGVMDMLRFDQFTAGRYWVDDYGYPSRESDWRVLRAYSPLHNIRAGVEYPAMLVTTADTDDRVVPGHSFKYTAALQAAGVGSQPQLIRVETRAGHGSGKPTDKLIQEYADILTFLGHHTGLRVPPAGQ
ncbi:S9 family peptidase [Erythrobacteraceae bacterium CFH 75059]|uniref:prolyl oligopeptidase family serine peptidase n=1 Tax=Qipengyuania thermophila TaxID=2509361 RepID=UPI00101FD971|nr:prolyl oligopeptidase family serine peptidase [Qipengyuania thermophila]TCD05451.1 S9 family peptidase [Erythrobacteraceae bacterium CFH 75059]